MVRISSWPSILTRLAFSTFSNFPRRARIACRLESRPCLAEPPAESPSTRNSSVSSFDSASAVGQFAGQAAAFETVLAAGQLARLLGGFAGLGGQHPFFKNRLRFLGMLFKKRAQLFGDR